MLRSSPSSVTSIFSSGPSITADGTLKFALTPNAYGSTRYTVWLTDTANKSSHTVSFVLEVININDRPRLTIPARIVAFEGQPFHYVAGTDITRDDSSGNSVLDWEYDQRLTFMVNAAHEDLFTELPYLTEQGLYPWQIVAFLTFEVCPFVYGTTYLDITVKDDGGVELAGQDTTHLSIMLEIVAVHQEPQFEKIESIFFLRALIAIRSKSLLSIYVQDPITKMDCAGHFPETAHAKQSPLSWNLLQIQICLPNCPASTVSGQYTSKHAHFAQVAPLSVSEPWIQV